VKNDVVATYYRSNHPKTNKNLKFLQRGFERIYQGCYFKLHESKRLWFSHHYQ